MRTLEDTAAAAEERTIPTAATKVKIVPLLINHVRRPNRSNRQPWRPAAKEARVVLF